MKHRSAVAKRNVPAKRSSPRFGFIVNIIAELRKVVWLTRRELAYLTALVLLVAVIMGLILGVIDYGFTRLVNDILLSG